MNYEEELKKGCGKEITIAGKSYCGKPIFGKIHYCLECKAELKGYQKAKEDFLKIIDEFFKGKKDVDVIDIKELKNKLESKIELKGGKAKK